MMQAPTPSPLQIGSLPWTPSLQEPESNKRPPDPKGTGQLLFGCLVTQITQFLPNPPAFSWLISLAANYKAGLASHQRTEKWE